MSSIGKKIAKGTFWTAVETWGHQGMVFLVFVVLARLLGPSSVGLAALAMSAPIIFAVPVNRGIPDAIVQRQEIDGLHLDSAFWLLTAAGVVLSGIVWLSAGLIGAAFEEPALSELVRFSCIFITLQAIAAVPMAILKREMNFRMVAMRALLGTLSGGIVGIALAVAGYGVWSLVWMQVSKALVEACVLLLFGNWRPGLRFSYPKCQELYGFAAPIVGFSLWQYVNDELPKITLGAFLGPAAVGIYSVARRPLELLTNTLLGPVTGMAMPAVSRLQGDKDKINKFFDGSIRVAMLVGFPAFIGFAAIAPDIIPLVFGEQWATSVVAVQILLILGLIRCIDSICGGAVLALGQSRIILALNILYTVLLSMMLLVAARMSVEATAVALVIANLIVAMPMLYYAREWAYIDITKPLRILPRLLLATVSMFFAVTAWRHLVSASGEPVIVASAIAVGALVYGAAVVLLLRPDLLAARSMILKARG
ncbi:MAG: lipopolysaccharide biosynthesis protein [Hyphomicrobium sp.]